MKIKTRINNRLLYPLRLSNNIEYIVEMKLKRINENEKNGR